MSYSTTADMRAGLTRQSRANRSKSTVHRLALACVWITIASGAVVFTEPAPFDLLMMGLIVLLPVIGLAVFPPGLLMAASLWLLVTAGGLVASTMAFDLGRSTTHAVITLYLAVAATVLAAFVARNPRPHTRLIFNAYLVSAFIAAVAGIAGYFDIFPGAHELFTTYDRARGTFKDPNVFGPFLVPPLVWAVHMGLNARPLRATLPLIAVAFLSFAVLLSFSRGAWANLAIALFAYGTLAFLLADGDRKRVKLVGLISAAIAAAALAFTFAMQFEAVSDLISQRASLSQSYDVNPGGRFDGQLKARDLAAAHPLGIGAGEFNTRYHAEDVHNVYLSMLLNAGWLGGFGYLCVVLVTLAVGLRQLLKRSPVQDLLIIAWACFLAVALEGLIVDTDHWRHFFVLMALVWGLSETVRSTESHPARARATEFAETRLRIPPLPAAAAFVSSAHLMHTRQAALPPRLPPAPGGFGRRR